MLKGALQQRPKCACRRSVVSVYPLQAQFQYLDWPERAEREFAWLSPGEAAERVDEDQLSALLRDFRPGE